MCTLETAFKVIALEYTEIILAKLTASVVSSFNSKIE